jgi:stearoyl-CoA desaturase (delta-9 desaturase)
MTTPLQWNTFILAVIGYITAGLGITVGYHRMFAHKAFSAHWPTRLFILLCGTSAFQGSCLWWARDHRAHHRYVDTDKDPYNSRRGFFWAHMGWLLVKQNKAAVGKADCADLEADPLLAWQEKYFLPLSTFLAIGLPVTIAGLGWGDWRGGFFFAAVARSVMVMQSTFCVNSLAHYIGDHTFTDAHTPRDSWWVSLVTFGEGYHNFHHEFPYDFRNGVHWYAYDPSKWVIWIMAILGGTFDLKRFPENEIEKGRLQMIEKKTQKSLAKLNWGPSIDALPLFTMDDVKRRVLEGSSLVAINGFVHDVHDFIPAHPGGEALIKAYLGKDATDAFNGGVYGHSNGAQNLLGTFRVGRVVTEEERIAIRGCTSPLEAPVPVPMQEVN